MKIKSVHQSSCQVVKLSLYGSIHYSDLPEGMADGDVPLACKRRDRQNRGVSRSLGQQPLQHTNSLIKRVRVGQPDVHKIEWHSFTSAWGDEMEKKSA